MPGLSNYVPSVIGLVTNTDIDAAAEQITATSTKCLYCIVAADVDNSDDIFIGDSTVADGTGIRLDAGENIRLDIDDVSKIYAFGGAANQGVSVVYFQL